MSSSIFIADAGVSNANESHWTSLPICPENRKGAVSVDHTNVLEADRTNVELVSNAYLGVCACVSAANFDRVMWQCQLQGDSCCCAM